MLLPKRATAAVMTLALFATACSCSGDSSATTTTQDTGPSATVLSQAGGLLQGLTPFPSQPSLESVVEAFDIATSDGTLIAHHLDRTIPWEILLAESPLPHGFDGESSPS